MTGELNKLESNPDRQHGHSSFPTSWLSSTHPLMLQFWGKYIDLHLHKMWRTFSQNLLFASSPLLFRTPHLWDSYGGNCQKIPWYNL